ncbi:hypothetical protein E2C01_035929 [Portunus trituberculatus]|uniref:Uncharacterized protein n=1 Tax=Portunus trituberculatus TaxID=210409 RepID=A0A5B7F4G4_PORTR|nr:hypothetical protein [Portunus trituberculatus]
MPQSAPNHKTSSSSGTRAVGRPGRAAHSGTAEVSINSQHKRAAAVLVENRFHSGSKDKVQSELLRLSPEVAGGHNTEETGTKSSVASDTSGVGESVRLLLLSAHCVECVWNV